MRPISIYYLFLPLILFRDGASPWALKTEKDGVTVYSRRSALSKFNDLKVEMDLPGTVDQLSCILLDVEKYPQWAYCTKSADLIKQIGKDELVYYSEISAPWPLANRDLYADIKVTRDSSMHSICLVSNGLKDFLPEKKGLVRVPRSRAVWTISTKSDKTIHLQYVLEIDPGGALPAWIVNMFASKGPLETFSNLRKKMELLNR
ncbi:START domain-containing protein [Puia dinghuensis]|uniref:START domain-containing protein n=1 Tax=Puia dinghuensis TaxID=1792502 RepID=A0A8J2UCR7_9BACT|nr:START domain-containing protein [Puia dinghuensis]GGA97660.1 hypothetical protein GCM10011511_21240 [Puia dinghuensis]